MSGVALNPLGAFIVELFRLNGTFLSEGDRITRDLNLSSARWQVIGALELAERPLSVSGIARAMGLTRQSVQRVANELSADGLIAFEDNPEHRRAKNVIVTEQGRKAFTAAMRRQGQWGRNLLLTAQIGDRQLTQATALLRKMRVAVTETKAYELSGTRQPRTAARSA